MPCVVIDMGTASTISVLDKNGSFLGGVISAGVRLTLKALTENTALLSSIPIEAPKSVIGSNTTESMQSGLVYGTAAMIDGILEKITEELGEKPTVVATGGLSREIITHCKNNIIYNENLLLEGLRVIYEKNH
jgi:type III pantothenate kinase